MNLNYLIPLFGALIPSIIQAKRTNTQEFLNEDYFGRFTLNFIYAVIVLIASCMTIHAGLLNKVIYFGEFNANHSISNHYTITLIHYIVMVGMGLPFIVMLIFDSFVGRCKIKKLTIQKVIVYVILSLVLTGIGINILFIESIFNLK